MRTVTTPGEVSANLRRFDSYRLGSADEAAWFSDRLRLGNKFVAGRIEGRLAFAPSRVAGYADCSIELHRLFPSKDGRETNRALTKLLSAPEADQALEDEYLALCRSIGAKPAKRRARAFWVLSDDVHPDPVVRYAGDGFPAEVKDFVEGATRRVIVNAYERDSKARDACIAYHGLDCAVCGFNFQAAYGHMGHGFIHVHHLTPISRSKGRHKVDPITEMRPVCANCHAMLHKADPPLGIDDLRAVRASVSPGV